jgi:hypothetical protein
MSAISCATRASSAAMSASRFASAAASALASVARRAASAANSSAFRFASIAASSAASSSLACRSVWCPAEYASRACFIFSSIAFAASGDMPDPVRQPTIASSASAIDAFRSWRSPRDFCCASCIAVFSFT